MSMLRIVVVEEDRLMRQLLVEWLEGAGYEVRAFSSGADVAGAAPDLVIVDVYMPRQGGAARLAGLRARWPETPLVATSAQVCRPGHLASPEAARELGARRLIAKPYARDTLLAAVREATLKTAPG
jgi:CheY-like chemotaxis protein